MDFHGYPPGYASGYPSWHFLQLMAQLVFYFSEARTSLKFLIESVKIVHAFLGTELCLLMQRVWSPRQPSWAKKKGQDSLSWVALWFGGQESVCVGKKTSFHTWSLAAHWSQPSDCTNALLQLIPTLPPLALCSSWQPLGEMWMYILQDDHFAFSAMGETTLMIKTPVKQNRVTGFFIQAPCCVTLFWYWLRLLLLSPRSCRQWAVSSLVSGSQEVPAAQRIQNDKYIKLVTLCRQTSPPLPDTSAPVVISQVRQRACHGQTDWYIQQKPLWPTLFSREASAPLSFCIISTLRAGRGSFLICECPWTTSWDF